MRFTYQGRRCVETLALPATPANIKFATRFAAELRQKIAHGVFNYAEVFPSSTHAAEGGVTFKVYAERWLKTLAHQKATMLGFQNAVNNFWVPAFGNKLLDAVRPADVNEALATKAATVSGKTLNNLLVPLRLLYSAAVDDGLLARSPLENIKNRKHQKPQPDPLTVDEMEAVLDYLAAHAPPTLYNYFLFAFTTGLRPSEQIALRWGDVDWNARLVRVERAMVRHTLKPTKTFTVRDVSLNDRALSALTKQKALTFMRGVDAAIFCSPDGKPWLSERRQRVAFWQPALRACGIRQRHAYQTRHTFATTLLMAGVHPSYIARQLGHASTAMLFQHYARWIDGADKGEQSARANKVFGPNVVQTYTKPLI